MLKVSESKLVLERLFKNPAVNWYPTLIIAGKGEGGDRRRGVMLYLSYTVVGTSRLSSGHFPTAIIGFATTIIFCSFLGSKESKD